MKIGKVEKSRDGWNLRKGGDLRKKKYQHTVNFNKYAQGPKRQLRIE